MPGVSHKVKCSHVATFCSLGALVNNVGEDKVKMLITSLCDKLISGKKDSQRETASLGLKSVTADLSAATLTALPFTIPQLVLPKLKQGLQAKVCHALARALHQDASWQIASHFMMASQDSQETVTECLDILTEVLLRFGRSMKDEHLMLKDILLKYVADARSLIRKRAVSCIGGFLYLYPKWNA